MMIVVVVGRFYFIEMLGIQDIIIIIIIIIVMKQQILPRAKGKATQHIFSTKTVSNHEYWFQLKWPY
jgi:hypothetical protein